MADDGGVAAKLAGATAALKRANNSNVSTRSGQPFGHSYSEAPYSMARAATKPAAPAKPKSTGEDIAEGLASKKQNVEAYTKAVGE